MAKLIQITSLIYLIRRSTDFAILEFSKKSSLFLLKAANDASSAA